MFPAINPCCQRLESRRLLAVTLVDGLLRIVGTSGDDQIAVGLGDTSDQIQVNINGSVSNFQLTDIRRITILGRAGDDNLSVRDAATPFPRNVLIKGGDGNDVLSGGSGDDTILGGRGADEIWGFDGHDLLLGGGGNDWFAAGPGDDSLNGGVGSDTLNGQEGHDTLSGGAGDDVLSGNEDADSLFGGAGNDRLVGDQGGDFLSGGLGDDTLDGGPRHDRLMGGPGHDNLQYVDKIDELLDFNQQDTGNFRSLAPLTIAPAPTHGSWLRSHRLGF